MKRTKPWKKSPKKSKNESSNQQLISKTSRPPFGLEIFFLLFFLIFLKDLNLNQSHWTDCESSADWSFSSSTQIVSGQKIESLRSDPIREWRCLTNNQSDLASDRRPIENMRICASFSRKFGEIFRVSTSFEIFLINLCPLNAQKLFFMDILDVWSVQVGDLIVRLSKFFSGNFIEKKAQHCFWIV